MHRSSRPRAVLSLLAALWTAAPLGLAQEESRLDPWRRHYARVERELAAYGPPGASSEQRAARSRLIAALADYRQRGEFVHQDEEPLALVPRFRDREGHLCAVAELLHATSRDDVVSRVQAEANDAWVADLAGDAEFLAWLELHGLTLAEAARIQTPTSYRPAGDTVPPEGNALPPDDMGTKDRPQVPPSGTGLAPVTAAPAVPTGAARLDDSGAWWEWWEFNKLAYLPVQGLEERLRVNDGRSPAEVALMTDPLRRAREPILLAGLSDQDALVRASAALSLGRLAGERAVEPLRALLSDSSQRVRECALFGLGASGSSAGAQVLLELLEHDGRLVDAGESVSPRVLPLTLLSLAVGRRAGMDAGVAPAVALFAARAPEASRPLALWAACFFHRLAPSPATEALALQLLEAKDLPSFVRCAAIEALGPSNDPKVLARLQGLLMGRNVELRRSAALSLARSPLALATSALLTAYEFESEPLARGFLLLSIGLRGGLPARDLLLEEFARGPIAVEPWVALALGLHARTSADATVRAALLAGVERVRNEDTRSALFIALGLAGEPRAQALARAALEGSESVRERGYAATTLALLGGAANRDLLRVRLVLERSAFVRATIAQALTLLGEARDVEGLSFALTRLSDPGLKAVTAASLGLLGVPAVLPRLETLAGDLRGSALVRATAIDGLGVLLDRGEPLVLPELSQGSNYATYADWTLDLFQLTL